MFRLSVPIAVSLLAACATREPAVVSASGSTFSGASSYGASSYEPLNVAGGAAAPGELMVRPDRVVQPFAIRSREGAAAKHFEALEAAVKALEARLAEATGGAAKVEIVGMRLERRGGKVRDGGLAAVLDGEVVLPLGADASVWTRSRALFGLQEVAALVAEEGLQKDDPRDFSFGVPNPQVADPDRYRAQLIDQWSGRAKDFIQSASTAGAPLAVVDCRSMPVVRQRTISIERVGLSLDPTCRIDLAPAPAPARSPAP